MIRHCVFIRFSNDTGNEHKHHLYSRIEALKARLPGILAVHSGKNSSPETGMDKGFSEGFMVDFLDAKSRDEYLEDDEHRLVGAEILKAAEGGVDGIFVYDIEVPDT